MGRNMMPTKNNNDFKMSTETNVQVLAGINEYTRKQCYN